MERRGNIGFDREFNLLQYAAAQTAYNWDCCGISFEYRRFSLGSSVMKTSTALPSLWQTLDHLAISSARNGCFDTFNRNGPNDQKLPKSLLFKCRISDTHIGSNYPDPLCSFVSFV